MKYEPKDLKDLNEFLLDEDNQVKREYLVTRHIVYVSSTNQLSAANYIGSPLFLHLNGSLLYC